MSEIRVESTTGLRGEIAVPGDKSISHRAVILGSLAVGVTRVRGFLESEDCMNTVSAFRRMGIPIERTATGELEIHGDGLDGLKEPGDVIDIGNSGTGIRLICGVLAGQPFYSVITGDESIRNRPMGRVTKPLRQMGAQIYGRDGGNRAPLTVIGGDLKPIHYKSPVASAQVKSALLLAGLFTEGETSVTEPALSRNHTELMLRGFGADVRTNGTTATVLGRPSLQARDITVPGDISSAAYFLVAALIVPDSEITVRNVGINPTRTGVLDVLRAMGADLTVENVREEAGEPAADITARTSNLKGTEIRGETIPRLIDEIPILAVAAAAASGETVIADAQELRVKETDRIAAVASELSKFGVEIEEQPDGMVIRGGSELSGAECESHGDHRIAMSCTVAGLAARGQTLVRNTENIRTSFPGFEDIVSDLTRLSV
ncbi:MAG: 3-phosphoshikimate 1-carboxyvinyltransferase [Armatimonadetes bacterium]|nr:3-phosphoshikimate 1-carboxyvinyltransferase [Armatimonadota bacterium]